MMKRNWLKILALVVLFGAVIWAGKGVFKYNVFSTHDGNHHIARGFDAVQTFAAGEFPLRWSGSLNYFCGAPIYNFYYPLLYYLVVFLHPIIKDIIFSLNIIFFASLLVGTFAFYFWAKEETGKIVPAFAGAMVYLFAPYRFLLIFVRGSPEYLAYTIFPIVLYLYAKTFNSKDKKFVLFAFLASLAGAVLTISHNFTAMFLMPIILIYLVTKIMLLKLGWKKICWLALSYIGAFAMGSFFIGPAVLEQKYTSIGANFIMWRDHFPTLWQIWNSKWGYFYSASGTANDGMSFMLGYAQWAILAFAALFIIYRFFASKFKIVKFLKENVFILIFFLGTLLSLYLILPWSIPVWERIKQLQEIQFSWRILGVAVLTIAMMLVYILEKIKSKFILIGLGIGISLFAVVAERNHMLPQPISAEDLYRYSDFTKLHPETYSTTTLGDEILPPTAKSACWFTTPVVSTNNEKDTIDYKLVDRNNTSGNVKFVIGQKLKGDKLILALSYFPGIFNININGSEVKNYSDCNGRVCIDNKSLRLGANFLSWKVGENQTELLFDRITIGFFVFWVILLFIRISGIYRNRKLFLTFVISLFVFTLFLFFRAYNLTNRLGFGWDQERDARAVSDILSGKFTLIGPRVQGPMGFYLPPYFFYILLPFYYLGHLSPFAAKGFLIFWSILFFGVGFAVISKIFNRWIALLFLAFWAVNNLAVSADTIEWNPVVIPLIELLLIYIYYVYLRQKRTIYIFLSGLVFGLGASFHLQFLLLFPFLFPLLIDIFKSRKFVAYLYLLIGIVVPFVPIILFDIRHNFLNLKLALAFSESGAFSGNRVIYVFSREAAFITGINASNALAFAFYFLTSAGLLYLAYRLKNEIRGKIFLGLGLSVLLSIPLFFVFIKNPSEYYFNYLLVPSFLLLAYLISVIRKLGIVLSAVLIIYFAIHSTTLFTSYDYFLTEKDNSVRFLSEVVKNAGPFNVSFDVPFNEDSGFRYLLDYHGVRYSGNPKDPLIEFVIPPDKKTGSFFIGKIGIYFPPVWIKNNWIR